MVPFKPHSKSNIFYQLLHENCPLYNIGGHVKLVNVDIGKLTRAHELLITRHDVFGIRIINTDDLSEDHKAANLATPRALNSKRSFTIFSKKSLV